MLGRAPWCYVRLKKAGRFIKNWASKPSAWPSVIRGPTPRRRSRAKTFARRAGDLADIINLDGAVTGLNRAAMITQMFGAGRVNVLSVAGRLSGYAMARPFGQGHVLGPLVASDDTAAEALFAATAEPGVLRVDRPFELESLGRFMTARDLPGHEISHTMARGAPPRGDGPSRIFSMAGHAWG